MMSLSQWEKDLRERISYAELLGEIDLDQEQIQQLGRQIAQYVQQLGSGKAVDVLAHYYPTCLAVYLVGIGIYTYHEGNYWTGAVKDIGLASANAQSQLRSFFEQFVQQCGLPAFRGAGHKFVGSILLHGGIPDYSLPDFFDHFLSPVLTRSEYDGLAPKDVIATWLEHTSHVGIDKPIIRFLQQGGKIAVDFVARCIDMGRHYASRGGLPATIELSLPRRVTLAYQQWMQNRENNIGSSQLRLVRPSLFLDPWGGLFLDLPSQKLSSVAFDEQQDVCWKITIEKETQELRCYGHWVNDHYVTEASQLEIAHPEKEYRVALSIGPGAERTWKFTGITAAQPLLVFDPENQGVLPIYSGMIPARRIWLLYQLDRKLSVPEGIKCEVFPGLSGGWDGYRAEEWDLSSASELSVGSVTLPVEPDLSNYQPYLVGECVTGLLHEAGSHEVFSAAPEIRIPFPPQRDPNLEARRWRITIRMGEVVWLQSALLEECRISEKELCVTLASAKFLGKDAFGQFEIALRGPLGRDRVFLVSIVPQLAVQVRPGDEIRFANEKGLLPSPQLTVRVMAGIAVECVDSASHVYAGEPGVYHIEAASLRTQLELRFLSQQKQSQRRVVSCIVPLPIVCWTVTDGEMKVTPQTQWHRQQLKLSQAWLEQASAPRLLISLQPPEGHGVSLMGRLFLHYQRRGLPQVLAPRSRKNKWLIFHLGEVVDSIRSSRESFVQLQFVENESPLRRKPLSFVVLRISRTLDISMVYGGGELIEDHWHLTFRWNESQQLSGRSLLLWSLWRPWAPAIEIAIPDEASGQFETSIAQGQLVPGAYRAEFAIIDPWVEGTRFRPLTETANTIDFLLGTPYFCQEYQESLSPTVNGYLERFLATSHPQHRVEVLNAMAHKYSPRDIIPLFETFLVEAEYVETEEGDEWYQCEAFALFQRLLLFTPIDLLLLMRQRISYHTGDVVQQLKVWLYKLSVPLVLLLEQIRLDNSVNFAELIALVPALKRNQHLRAETFARLQDAGISVVDTADGEEFGNIEELYADLPEWLLNAEALDSSRLYLQELCAYPLLNAEQEVRLARQVLDGQEAKREEEALSNAQHVVRIALLKNRMNKGKEARNQLITSNLRLTVNIAKRYMGRSSMELLDLIQEGNLGLMRAVEKFDPSRGYKFSTYATWWIRQAITRSISDRAGMIRLPAYMYDLVNRFKYVERKLISEKGREPTSAEIAAELGVSLQKVEEFRNYVQQGKMVSLDSPLSGEEEEGGTLKDIIENEDSDPQDTYAVTELRERFEELFKQLKEREVHILQMRVGWKDERVYTLEAIGAELGITRERVRQIESRAIEKLMRPGNKQLLSEYTDN